MHPERIRCTDIRPDPRRDRVGSSDLDTLADSIRRYGVLRPILLRPTPDGYVIVHGERRWRAAQSAGLQAIPAMIVQDFQSESASARADAGAWELAAADD